MSKHTPAPWNIAPRIAPYIATSNDPKIREWMESTGKDQFDALSVGTAKGSVAIIPLDESNEANAKLIAAAPELLEALQNIVKNAESAIFEEWLARTMPSGDCDLVQYQWTRSTEFDGFCEDWKEANDAIEKATK